MQTGGRKHADPGCATAGKVSLFLLRSRDARWRHVARGKRCRKLLLLVWPTLTANEYSCVTLFHKGSVDWSLTPFVTAELS